MGFYLIVTSSGSVSTIPWHGLSLHFFLNDKLLFRFARSHNFAFDILDHNGSLLVSDLFIFLLFVLIFIASSSSDVLLTGDRAQSFDAFALTTGVQNTRCTLLIALWGVLSVLHGRWKRKSEARIVDNIFTGLTTRFLKLQTLLRIWMVSRLLRSGRCYSTNHSFNDYKNIKQINYLLNLSYHSQNQDLLFLSYIHNDHCIGEA